MKSVRFNDAREVMEQMLRVPIFRISEKRIMLMDGIEDFTGPDPNLIMDARHKIFKEPLPMSPSRSSILAEAKRLLLDEESEVLFRKKEQELLEAELRKFQQQLCKSRPKFHTTYSCTRKALANSDNDNFWRDVCPKKKSKEFRKCKGESGEDDAQNENSYSGNIKITIKDKPVSESKERRMETLRNYFEAMRQNAWQEKRLRDIKTKIQKSVACRRLRQYFTLWKMQVDRRKELAKKKKDERDMTSERKIELFVNAIAEKQKELAKTKRLASKEPMVGAVGCASEQGGETRKLVKKRVFTVDPPAHNRLTAQKKIIAEQRAKLAEQNRIIEDMRLKQMESDSRKTKKETINVAKEALAHCGRKTRRTLIQLMREEGCRNEPSVEAPRLPSPPQFLLRMEARAEARRQRVRIAEEARQRKLEEEKEKKAIARKEEEQERKRIQLEAQKEAKRLREEHEQRRAREAEKITKLNAMADLFYRTYLLRRYVMKPFTILIEIKYNNIKKANDHYGLTSLRKTFMAWKIESQRQHDMKVELAESIYHRNLMWRMLKAWTKYTEDGKHKYQVAGDFYEMRLQQKYLKSWCTSAFESKMRTLENEQLAHDHHRRRLRVKYLEKWKRYPEIAKEVQESERTKDKWRELVQRVVPDFDPKYRGVMIDD
ncbi:trichohyalin [Cephus cinctus]|uniref:Trichohyalin n=1 Tax=Cephus cinctus TaxID=211228 RepID=A0AAJ7BQP5_CEPCN|nr:trichohyalin [Cephus cinctus]